MARRSSARFWAAHTPIHGEDAAGRAPAVRFDTDEVRALLIDAARRGEPLTYSDCLNRLGLGFSRPKMRALCKVLDAIDQAGVARGEPELAVLVVRQSDLVPGQGWWTGRPTPGYSGPWEGPEARAFIEPLQQAAYRHWQAR
jgi:hypothetical protein